MEKKGKKSLAKQRPFWIIAIGLQYAGSFEKKKGAISLGLLFLFLLLHAVAFFPHAHEAIHHDASDDEHQCAATLLLKGDVQPEPPPRLFSVSVHFLAVMPETALIPLPSIPYRLLPGRAPPSAS